MKLLAIFATSLLSASAYALPEGQAGIIPGDIQYVQSAYGDSIEIEGEAALRLFALLKDKKIGEGIAFADGYGVTCRRLGKYPLTCQITLSPEGAIDLLSIPH